MNFGLALLASRFLFFGPDVSVLGTQVLRFSDPGLYGHRYFGEMGILHSLIFAYLRLLLILIPWQAVV